LERQPIEFAGLAAQGRAKPPDSLPDLCLIDSGIAKQQASAALRLQRIGRERWNLPSEPCRFT
jgi:hypothetical protein